MKQALTAGDTMGTFAVWRCVDTGTRPGAAEPEKTDTPIRQTEQADSMDSRSVLQVYDGEKTVSMTMAEYLPGWCGGRCPPPLSPRP